MRTPVKALVHFRVRTECDATDEQIREAAERALDAVKRWVRKNYDETMATQFAFDVMWVAGNERREG